MLCRTRFLLTATPEKFTILGTTHPRPTRHGFGRENKMRSKPSDNVAWYDKGPVEWLPRPVRITYRQLDELRDWMMKDTLQGKTESFHTIRAMHREWSQHPLMPVLGDVEPKFPLNLYKQNHRAKRRFLLRWHKANSPQHWLWCPRGPGVATPLHYQSPSQFPEHWEQQQQHAATVPPSSSRRFNGVFSVATMLLLWDEASGVNVWFDAIPLGARALLAVPANPSLSHTLDMFLSYIYIYIYMQIFCCISVFISFCLILQMSTREVAPVGAGNVDAPLPGSTAHNRSLKHTEDIYICFLFQAARFLFCFPHRSAIPRCRHQMILLPPKLVYTFQLSVSSWAVSMLQRRLRFSRSSPPPVVPKKRFTWAKATGWGTPPEVVHLYADRVLLLFFGGAGRDGTAARFRKLPFFFRPIPNTKYACGRRGRRGSGPSDGRCVVPSARQLASLSFDKTPYVQGFSPDRLSSSSALTEMPCITRLGDECVFLLLQLVAFALVVTSMLTPVFMFNMSYEASNGDKYRSDICIQLYGVQPQCGIFNSFDAITYPPQWMVDVFPQLVDAYSNAIGFNMGTGCPQRDDMLLAAAVTTGFAAFFMLMLVFGGLIGLCCDCCCKSCYYGCLSGVVSVFPMLFLFASVALTAVIYVLPMCELDVSTSSGNSYVSVSSQSLSEYFSIAPSFICMCVACLVQLIITIFCCCSMCAHNMVNVATIDADAVQVSANPLYGNVAYQPKEIQGDTSNTAEDAVPNGEAERGNEMLMDLRIPFDAMWLYSYSFRLFFVLFSFCVPYFSLLFLSSFVSSPF
eukprot:gene8099-5635_t